MTHGREGRPEQTHRARRRWLIRVAGAAVTLAVAQWPYAAVAVPGEEYLGDPESDASVQRPRAVPRDDAGARARARRSTTTTPPRKFRLPPPAADERGDEEESTDGLPTPTVYRVGFGRSFEDHDVDVPGQGALRWRLMADGGQVATFELVSPGAAGLRAQLVFEAAPARTEVRVYDPNAPATTTEVVPLTATWREELAAGGTAAVWTPTVFGDELAVEFYLPRGVKKGDLRFSVPRVSHLDVHPMRSDDIGAARCGSHVDAACRTDMVSSVARRAVAKYVFTSGSGRSGGCTGTLLNDLDPATQVPYFLTAEHCIGSAIEAANVEFYWFFERTACAEDSAVRTVRTVGGATLLAAEEANWAVAGTDFALVRLNRPPPRGVGLAGWTDSTVSVGDRLVEVHHPARDLKKVATGTVSGFRGYILSYIPTHISVRQDSPLEGGSSGSGAWKRVDGQDLLVGILTASTGGCSYQTAIYGRLDRFYPQVRRWLGGGGTREASESSPVAGLVLLDAVTGATVADLTDGDASIDLGLVGRGPFNIRADTSGVLPDNVRLDLTGTQTAALTSTAPPFTLYGPGGGSGLAPGSYEVTASPYESDGTALAARTAGFAVTGRAAGDAMAVAGLTLLNAAGEVVSAIADGGDLTAPTPRTVAIVARTAGDAVVGRVEFAVSGEATLSHTAVKAPFRMRAELSAGTYRIVATPYAPEEAGGAGGSALTVADFTLGYEVSPVTGFTLVDARGRAPDPDLQAIEDGDTVNGGYVSIRADVGDATGIGSVRLELTGPVSASRLEDGPAPYALLGDDQNGDYGAGRLVSGTYWLKATPYTGRGGAGVALRAHEVSFTIPYVPPIATVAADPAPVSEGAVASFEVSLDRAPDRRLAVAVTVSETGDAVSGVPPRAVTFEPDRTSATLAVATDDDAAVEAASTVTATLTARTGYTVGEPAAATVTVWDDDAAVFEVTAAPELIEEGGSATVTVSITNGVTYAGDRTVSLSVSGLAAGSYTLEPATAVLAAGTTSVTAAFTALADDAEERPKTARIAAMVDGAEVGAAELSVEDPAPAPRIAGVPQVGGVLDAVLDDTVADSATAWQWLGDGAPIAGATQERYVPVETDVGAALSVRVQARGRERTSTATVPVWPAPANPPLAAAEEELLGTTLTLGSRTFGVGVAGFSRLPGREFGSVEDAAFALGDRELTLFMVNKWGNLGLAATPPVADAAGLTAYWNEYGIGSLRAAEVDDTPAWAGRTPQPPEEFERYVTGASDGVRVAVSIRAPLPAATLSALSGTVPEGSAATFEVALDRAAWSARTVSLSVLQEGAVLSEAAPVSVAFAAGESRATVTLATVDDAVIEGDGTVTATLVAGDGYVLGEETSVAVTVEDDDVAVFAVSVAAGELDEGGATTLTVEVANGKTFAEAQSIELSASGSASASDYRLAPATLALPANETSASATLTAVRDVAAEAAETVTVTATHDGSALGSTTVTIAANEAVVSTATVSAVSSPVTEGSAASFEVRLDAAALAALSVSVTVSETASMLSGAARPTVTFAVGESQKTVSLATTDDTVVEADSDVTLSILPGGGYTAGAASSATVRVADDDSASFGVSASPEEIDEGGSSTLTVSIANGVTFAADQSIALSVSGSASVVDYALAPETLTLAAGAGSVEATLTAVDDADEESAETATVTATHGGTAVGSATVTIRASDIPSDDASLASLVLSDVDIGPFSPEATDYAAQVPSELSSTTVTVAANDAGAVVEIADAVGSTLGETRTVRLEEGGNAITVTVTAEDGATTRAYRVAVTRAYAAAWGEPLPERDIELGARAGPTGLWSDGATLWVVWDWRSGAVRAYDLDDGSLLPERGFELAGGSGFPSGLWSDGSTLWVSDFYGGVTAHRLSDGSRLPAEDLDGAVLAAAGNSGPSGLWSDGSTLWVADDQAWKAFAYRLSDKSRLASQEVGFRGNGDLVSPWGLWSDGETLLVSAPRRGMLHSYRLSDGAWQAQRAVDLSTVGISIPMGLWSDGRVLWVAGERETTVHAYAVPGLRRAAVGTFPVRVSSRAPRVPAAAQGGRSVGIPDAALRARIAAALGKPADAALGERELAALTALDARAAGVTDLTGLEYAVHLAALDLGDNALVDLRALADLPALTVLNLDRTGADLWSLARLTGLRRLSLRGNGLRDVQALRSLTALRVLDIGANRVADLAPLGGLSALEALRADGNAVQDASALRAMDLRILDLDGDAAAERSP